MMPQPSPVFCGWVAFMAPVKTFRPTSAVPLAKPVRKNGNHINAWVHLLRTSSEALTFAFGRQLQGIYNLGG